jgi:hypothetical protein
VSETLERIVASVMPKWSSEDESTQTR